MKYVRALGLGRMYDVVVSIDGIKMKLDSSQKAKLIIFNLYLYAVHGCGVMERCTSTNVHLSGGWTS